MQTLSAYLKEQKEKRRVVREQRAEKRRRVLESCRDVPAYCENAASIRRRAREALADPLVPVKFYGLACDICGTELFDDAPGCTFKPMERRSIVCPGCGWCGYFSEEPTSVE